MIPNHSNLHQRLIGQPDIWQTMAQHDDSIAITNQRYLTYYVHSPHYVHTNLLLMNYFTMNITLGLLHVCFITCTSIRGYQHDKMNMKESI